MDRKSWFILVGTTAALATATAVVLFIRRTRLDRHFATVPDLITDCYDRIKEIETDLTRLRTSAQPAS